MSGVARSPRDGQPPERIVLWGFSLSGGYVASLAARDTGLGASLVLCPFVNGLQRLFHTPLATIAWILPRALAELAGRDVRIPVTGPSGARAAMAFSGEANGFARAVGPDSPWRNEIGPAQFATIALHRPLAGARRISCPLRVRLGERDISMHGPSIARLAERTHAASFIASPTITSSRSSAMHRTGSQPTRSTSYVASGSQPRAHKRLAGPASHPSTSV